LGPWARVPPRDAASILTDFDRPWFVVGGYAIEAFTGVRRPHHDLDIEFFRADLSRLRDALSARYALWSVGSGLLRLIDDSNPGLHAESDQVWIREHAWAPWLLDLLASSGSGEEWVHRRDPTARRPLAEVVWTDDEGVRYLAPEIVLSFKAPGRRPQDEADFAACAGRLGDSQRTWLAEFLERNLPGHPWLDRLA
jgi:hypothetical protein